VGTKVLVYVVRKTIVVVDKYGCHWIFILLVIKKKKKGYEGEKKKKKKLNLKKGETDCKKNQKMQKVDSY
jgi:endonuclease III-like uncharacterized protein